MNLLKSDYFRIEIEYTQNVTATINQLKSDYFRIEIKPYGYEMPDLKIAKIRLF